MCALSEIQSHRSLWSTDIFPKWRSQPTRPSTQAKSERSKCFKIAVWPQHRGGPHTPSRILLHISVGIVRIQKCSALTGRPFWLERTHNALYCCCELLTAWAGPLQWRAALRSRQRGGIFDISPWWQPCYYSRFVLYASSLCGPTSPVATQNLIWMTNTFRLWSVRTALANSTQLVLKLRPGQLFSRTVWHTLGVNVVFRDTVNMLGWSIRSSFLVDTSGARTTGPQRIINSLLFHWCHMNTSLQFWLFSTLHISLDKV